MCQNILFAHAIGGSDTTSSLFTIGKSLPLRKVQESQVFRECAQVVTTTGSSREEIRAAGEKALVVLYGGKTGDNLDTLRHVKYIQKLSSCTTTLQQAPINIGSSAVPVSSGIFSRARMDLCNGSSSFPNKSNRLGMGNNGQRHVPGSDRHRRSTRRPSSRHQVQLQDRLSVFPMFLPSSWTRAHCRLWRMHM